jgi:hypothetical protein
VPINEKKLQETLIFFAETLKEQHTAIASMLGELVSLREAVRGLDPTFSEVIEKTRKETFLKMSAALPAGSEEFERLIEQLKAGSVC